MLVWAVTKPCHPDPEESDPNQMKSLLLFDRTVNMICTNEARLFDKWQEKGGTQKENRDYWTNKSWS